MATLAADQRSAILNRYGGLVRTYFNRQQLEQARFAYRPRLSKDEVEFHAYLRLSSILAAGRELPGILRRITLAPSRSQERVLLNSRGQVAGRLDIRSYLKRRGQLTIPRTYPNWRVLLTHVTPENALASATAQSLLSELQALSIRLPLANTSEESQVRRITEAIEQVMRDPALAESAEMLLPDVLSEESEYLFGQVAERWNTRRISNVAYKELWQWADAHRKRGLSEFGMLVGLAYSEEFDDRLFEIFCLGEMREALAQLGFREKTIRPLHERNRNPILEVEHPDSTLSISVFFQKGEGVVWTEGIPRDWQGIVGVPDICLVVRSSQFPVIIIDAKNRYRGSELEESFSEELYKMLGYFQNFSLRTRVQERGPVGGLMFLSRDGVSTLRTFESRSGGKLAVAALDPCDNSPGSVARQLLEEVLTAIGLLGGFPEVATALSDLKETAWYTGDLSGNEQVEEETLDRIHHLVLSYYGTPGQALLQATQGLELHLLGDAWRDLDEDVHSLLATGEVFWAQHQLALGMDFAPVVVELSKAMEVLIVRRLVDPYNRWAGERGFPSIKRTVTLGEVRALIESAKNVIARPPRRTEIQAFHSYLEEHSVTEYVFGDLLNEVEFVNRLRRRAAHKDLVTGTEAGHLRDAMLGVGTASPILARLAVNLGHL